MSQTHRNKPKPPLARRDEDEQPESPPEAWFAQLTRALGWNPLGAVDLGPVLESCSRTTDSWVAANRIALGAALAVAECQFRVLCQVMEDSVSAGADLLGADEPGAAVSDPAWQTIRGFERLQENMRGLIGIVARSQAEIADTMTRRLVEMAEEVETHLARLRQ